jgi:hypothetical protein
MDIIVDEISKTESMVAKKSIDSLKKSIENQPVGTKRIFSLSFNGNEETVPIPPVFRTGTPKA